jgi:hypothetical protein
MTGPVKSVACFRQGRSIRSGDSVVVVGYPLHSLLASEANITTGWALSQFPYLVKPDLTIYDATHQATLRLFMHSLIVGSIILFPFLFSSV